MPITSSSTYANFTLNEVLHDVKMKALTPKSVLFPLVNQDSIDGAASLTKEYAVDSDVGPAAAATEGTDFTTVTTMSLASSVSVTPTEAAVMRADITTRAARRHLPGMSADEVYGKLQAGDFAGMLDVLEDEANRIIDAIREKWEVDLGALLDDFSDTAGSSGTDLSFANILTAIYKLEENEPQHEQFAFVFHPEQMNNLRSAMLSLSAASSSLWTSQADASFVNFVNDVPRNGLKGSLLGIPVYQTSPSVNPLPNSGADVAGALMCLGAGQPGRGQDGALVFVEGHAPLFVLDFDASARTVELIGISEYGVAELRDAHGVSIITDAP